MLRIQTQGASVIQLVLLKGFSFQSACYQCASHLNVGCLIQFDRLLRFLMTMHFSRLYKSLALRNSALFDSLSLLGESDAFHLIEISHRPCNQLSSGSRRRRLSALSPFLYLPSYSRSFISYGDLISKTTSRVSRKCTSLSSSSST